MDKDSSRAPHVLNASTNLVGFSLILLTSLKFFKLGQSPFVDALVPVTILGFILSCIFSFFAMRATNPLQGEHFETVADYIFLTTLLLLFVVCILITVL